MQLRRNSIFWTKNPLVHDIVANFANPENSQKNYEMIQRTANIKSGVVRKRVYLVVFLFFVYLVVLKNYCKISLSLHKSASIHPKTYGPKFEQLVDPQRTALPRQTNNPGRFSACCRATACPRATARSRFCCPAAGPTRSRPTCHPLPRRLG